MEFMQIPSSTSHIIDKKYNAYKNTVAENNISIVETNKLDNIVTDNIVKGIKMDVEGAEIDAILGAKETLLSNKPKLNIALYHKFTDIFEIPLLIHEINPDYRFHIRRHPYIPCWDMNLYCE